MRWVFPEVRRTLLSARVTVGRADTCDTVLPGMQVSRRHAEFRVEGPIVVARDLRSSNGVFVNGTRVSDVPLWLGDVVRLGEWVGVAVNEAADDPGFREIAKGWFGGTTLARAIEPLHRVPSDFP